jgi:PAS domain S-box-containing protein
MRDVNGATQPFVERRKNSTGLDSLFSYSSSPMLVWDANFTIIRFNRAFELLTGRPFHQIFGRSLTELFPYDQIDQTLDLISATYDGERWKSVEIPLLHTNGSIRFVLWNSATIFEADGITATSTIAQGVDITERRLVEEKLRSREQQFRIITSSANDAIVMLDEFGTITFLNSSAEMLFGYSQEELIGQNLHSMLVPLAFREAHNLVFPHFQKTGQGAAIGKTVELAGLRKDGSEFPLELSLSAVQVADSWQSIGIIRDISTRKLTENILKENEEKYRAIVEAINGFIYICSQDYRIEFMNDAMIRRTGRDATGEYCFKALHDLDAICEWCVNKRIFAGETVKWEHQSQKDGTWYEINNSPIYRTNGTISKQAIIYDINERKRNELNTAKAAAESVNM